MMRRYALFLALLIAGTALNLAVAWSGAAWVAPASATPVFTSGPLADGEFEGVTSRRALGHTRLSRATFRVSADAESTGGIDEWEWHINGREYSETQAGWPLRAWRCRNYGDVERATATSVTTVAKTGLNPIVGGIALTPFSPGPMAATWRALPYVPMWPGVVGNAALYAAALGLLIAGPGWVRRRIRRRRRQCEACGYPIGTSPVCTECGAAVSSG